MAYLTGFTGQELVDAVLDIVLLSGKTGETSDALRYLNMAQYDLWLSNDWPEMVTLDASITTDGSDYYDLTDADSGVGSGFGRIIDGTVRVGTHYLALASKSWLDSQDVDRSHSGSPLYYSLPKRTDFRVWPYGSSGETVYFDWMALPVKLETSTTAANMSFAQERQQLIVEGAMWQMMRAYKQTDWMQQYQKYEREKKVAILNCKTVKPRSGQIRPTGHGLGF